MKVIDIGSGIKVVIDDTYTISKGETLVETRDNFLDMMGRVFDEAIYDSLTEDISEDEIDRALTGGRGLRSKVMIIDEYSHIPNTVMMQMLEEGKESYDTLKEITEYVKNNKIV
jgi:hypothetical protein